MSYRITTRICAALAAASIVLAGASPALALTGLAPGFGTHPDTAPILADGRDLQTPVSGEFAAISITGQLTGHMSGTNSISFDKFRDGDMVVVEDPAGITGHAGLFDRRFYVDIRSYSVISANVNPANGVQREQCLKYRANNEAWGLYVIGQTSTRRTVARAWAYSQMGKPYNLLAAKTDLRSFYCSKLAWAAWRYTAGVDLDADGGYWVWPIDLVKSPHTGLIYHWT
jgi:hypothetical protein